MEGMSTKSPSLNSPLSFGRGGRLWANRKDFSGSVFTDCAALYSGESVNRIKLSFTCTGDSWLQLRGVNESGI